MVRNQDDGYLEAVEALEIDRGQLLYIVKALADSRTPLGTNSAKTLAREWLDSEPPKPAKR